MKKIIELSHIPYSKRKYRDYIDNGICPTCKSKPAKPGIVLCEKCQQLRLTPERRAKQTALVTAYKEKHKKLGLCERCSNPRLNGLTECFECRRKIVEKRHRIKRELLTLYGGACACCGEYTIEFLSIDHVNRDGGKERKEGFRLWHLLDRYKETGVIDSSYQILCMNCNFSKGIHGYCPHHKIDILNFKQGIMTSITDAYKWITQEPGPKMITEAIKLYGVKEVPDNADNPEILNWAEETGLSRVYSHDSVPWCGLFMAIVAKRAGKELPESPLWALNWAKFGHPVSSAELGDVLVFRRVSGGHVALYIGETQKTFFCLGGNQSDAVTITQIEKHRCVAVRRPNYSIVPPNVRKIELSPSGEISTNEA